MASITVVEQPLVRTILQGQLTAANERASQSVEQACYAFARGLFPDAECIKPVQYQGGCSYSMSVQRSQPETRAVGGDVQKGDMIVQFRSRQFDLDITTTTSATEVYEVLVPAIMPRGLAVILGEAKSVYEMNAIPGLRLSELLPRKRMLKSSEAECLSFLLSGLADFFARGWKHAVRMESHTNEKHLLTGRVGSTIQDRLQTLTERLPTPDLRLRAQIVRHAVREGALSALPVVVSHGDLLPSNIMVDLDTWELRGVIDWAEAEYLPFGVALYGVEHMLGFLDGTSGSRTSRWMWYKQAESLRQGFWECLRGEISELHDPELLRSVKLAREVGVLLWHGFAWDDGKIDRAVNATDDADELETLRAFLEVV